MRRWWYVWAIGMSFMILEETVAMDPKESSSVPSTIKPKPSSFKISQKPTSKARRTSHPRHKLSQEKKASSPTSLSKSEALPPAPQALVAPFPRILVAEDNKMDQLLYRSFFKDRPYDMKMVEDGQQLVSRYVPGEVDVIITDSEMPFKTGLEAITILVGTYGKDNLPPIIAVTMNATPENKQKFLNAGAIGFLPKPVDKARLAEEIKRCLQGRVN